MSDQVESHVLAQYKPIKKIGSGAYGIVWKVTDRKTKQSKALKKNFDAFTNSTDAQRTYRQVMFLKQLKHPNIVRLDNIIRAQNDKDIYLVFQHMDIDLHTLIRDNGNSQHLQEKHKQYIIYQIAKSILYLHNSNIIHRDLKPSNILINENCEAKLCDFGLVRSLQQAEDSSSLVIMTDYIATRWYRAPELLLGCKDYSKEVDIWALGCLVGEMMRGKPMFPGNSTINQIEKILAWTGSPTPTQIKNLKVNINKGSFELLAGRKKPHKNDFLPNAKPQCMDLIKRMLEFDSEKRCSILDVLQHPYLSDFYDKKQIEEMCRKKVTLKLHINDNVKLSLKNYRALIYSEILEQNKGQPQFSAFGKSSNKNTITGPNSNSANGSFPVHSNNHIKKSSNNNTQEQRRSSLQLQKDKTEKRFKTQGVSSSSGNYISSEMASSYMPFETTNNLKTANSSHKKYTIFSKNEASKANSSQKRTIMRDHRESSSASVNKKKGISLCSKDLGSVEKYSKVKSTSVNNPKPSSVKSMSNNSNANSNTVQKYYNYSDREQSQKKYSTKNTGSKLGHYKRVKANIIGGGSSGGKAIHAGHTGPTSHTCGDNGSSGINSSNYDQVKKHSHGQGGPGIINGWFAASIINNNIGRKGSLTTGANNY